MRGEEQLWWKQARAAFPDMVFTVDLLIESDDLVVSNWTVKGTHTGTPFYDVPASGEPVIINGTAILRIHDGQIVEHWGGPHCQKGLGLLSRGLSTSIWPRSPSPLPMPTTVRLSTPMAARASSS